LGLDDKDAFPADEWGRRLLPVLSQVVLSDLGLQKLSKKSRCGIFGIPTYNKIRYLEGAKSLKIVDPKVFDSL
jgi:hypothetical protein